MAITLPLMVGCGGNGPVSGDGPVIAVPTRDPAPDFKVTVATDKSTYKTSDTINITVSVTNVGTTTHSLAYPTTDPIVRWGYIIAQNGNIVAYEYNSKHNRIFDDAVGVDQYASGASKTFNYVFPYMPSAAIQPVSLAPGTYQVYARQADLTYDGNQAIRHSVPTPASDPVTITITQ